MTLHMNTIIDQPEVKINLANGKLHCSPLSKLHVWHLVYQASF